MFGFIVVQFFVYIKSCNYQGLPFCAAALFLREQIKPSLCPLRFFIINTLYYFITFLLNLIKEILKYLFLKNLRKYFYDILNIIKDLTVTKRENITRGNKSVL